MMKLSDFSAFFSLKISVVSKTPQDFIADHWAQKGRASLFTCVSVLCYIWMWETAMTCPMYPGKPLFLIHLQIVIGPSQSKAVGHGRFVQSRERSWYRA